MAIDTPMYKTPLSQCAPESQCLIRALHGDLEMKLRLVNLGFHTHSHVKVVMKYGDNLVVCVDGSRFAIDTNIAQFIEVEAQA